MSTGDSPLPLHRKDSGWSVQRVIELLATLPEGSSVIDYIDMDKVAQGMILQTARAGWMTERQMRRQAIHTLMRTVAAFQPSRVVPSSGSSTPSARGARP